MNTHLRRTFYLFVAGFVGLVVMLAYWQVYSREALANNPENGFQTQRSVSSPRGLILAGDGETVLARSVKRPTPRGPVYDRVYPLGEPYSNVVGYWSTRYGATGIEISNNTDLSSIAGEPETLDDLINRATGGPQPGNNVVLTIDPGLQELAHQELSASSTGRGSVVALNPKTGEILAMATSPSFDPNNVDENYPELASAEGAPLINRATQSLYPPGSVFKVITAAAALGAGVSPQQTFFDSGAYELPGYTVNNFEGKDYGEVTFTRALAYSINVVFAKIAVDIVGAQPLTEMALDFGFGDPYDDFPLLVSGSSVNSLPPEQWTTGTLAQTAFGQGEVQSNAFQMALVAGAIANDGELMEPRIVREVRSPDGIILDKPTPSVRRQALPASTATTLNEMMQEVIIQGGFTEAEIEGMKVAGKTGTAESGNGAAHSWWITFAPADDPEIAMCVMIENGGRADRGALPIAARLMKDYLEDGV
ncbi:MAG: penicillin-binding protein 2 [Rubrobacteraceae bacterium]|nr:penicillin-binding protein 2 [Rubrobacteraceae bacterium]